MANKHKGEVSLQVGDREFNLRLTFLSLSELEDLGIHLLRGVDDSVGEASLIMKALFVMARGQDGVQSMQDVDELMMSNYVKCSEAVSEAITLFFQQLEGKTQKDATP